MAAAARSEQGRLTALVWRVPYTLRGARLQSAFGGCVFDEQQFGKLLDLAMMISGIPVPAKIRESALSLRMEI